MNNRTNTRKDMNHPNTILEVDQVIKVYGSGHSAVHALRGVSLHIERGEIVMVMGPSGAGKSTLLLAIGAMLRPTSGAIRIAETDIVGLSQKSLSRFRLKKFGFIFQSANLLPAINAAQNVELPIRLAAGSRREARIESKRLLEDVGLSNRTKHFPAELSGGEKQRVAVSRALVNSPSIILADEPTASLESKSGYSVVETLRRRARERNSSVLIVTHDSRIRNLADRVLWLEDGLLRLESSTSDAAVDPVCLMVVNRIGLEHVESYGGRIYHFCSAGCRNRFLENPEQYRNGDRATG